MISYFKYTINDKFDDYISLFAKMLKMALRNLSLFNLSNINFSLKKGGQN